MFKFKQRKADSIIITIGIVFAIMFLVNSLLINNQYVTNNSPVNIGTSQSVNPDYPIILDQDVSEYQYYLSEHQGYYYATYYMSTIDYHLTWLYTVMPDDDFDLHMYSDSSYSNLVGSSASPSRWEFLVYNPTSGGVMYPVVYTYTGIGPAHIEAEYAQDFIVGSEWSVTLNSTEVGELAEVYLESSKTYRVELDVPPSCNFDLYVFWVADGIASNTGNDYHSSTSNLYGQDEVIIFAPSTTTTYAIVMLWKGGTSGVATLWVDEIKTLANDISDFEDYSVEGKFYYYDTYYMYDYDYHLIWLYTSSSGDNFDLQIYSDSSYSNLVGSSYLTSKWDWLIYNPSSSSYMYPKVRTTTGTGYAYIEAEEAWDITVGGAPYKTTLSTSESGELAEVYLSSTTEYRVLLDVPAGCDFDLYITRVTDGSASRTGYDYHASESTTLGQDEEITFTPSASGDYAIVMLWKGGSSGEATLQVVESVVTLSNDIANFEYYSIEDEYYYYDTYSMDTNDYHLIWAFTESLGDLDLALFSDSSYTTSVGIGSGASEWVVYNPSSSGVMYPRVKAESGTGTAYIEAESGEDISVGGSFSKTLAFAESGELAEIDLYSTNLYRVKLTVPAGCNFDLYVFRLTPGTCTQVDYHASESTTLGQDEEIVFSPSADGKYALVMIRRYGSGTGTIKVDPITITTLSDDLSDSEVYSTEDESYFYDTYTMASNDYHLVWVATQTILDIDLYLYSDDKYSTLVGSSDSGTMVEWVVYNPSSNVVMYPKAYTDLGTGTAFIEAESGEDISVGSSFSKTLAFAESGELAEVALSSLNSYNITLVVPSGCDFDLYVFRVNSDTCTKVDYHTSTSSTLGQNEQILFTPTATATYAIVAIRRSGTGLAEIHANVYGNNVPTLTSGSVSPSTGISSTIFNYTVTYTDANNDPPSYMRVVIYGEAPQTMTKQNPSDMNFTDGCIYEYSTTLSPGNHYYHFEASDGTDTVRLPGAGETAGPTVNRPPTLISGSVSPFTGITSTMFNYTVTYTDWDNEAPSYIRIIIDGGAPQTMTKQNAGDSDYTDGCIYEYSTTLSSGLHNCYFEASDGNETARLPFGGAYGWPTVNTPPILTGGGVSPSIGSPSTTFIYSVNYTDADNDAPSYIRVIIDGGTPQNMTKQNTGDVFYYDGCIYEYSTTLSEGAHDFYFEASDGTEAVKLPTVGNNTGPTVNAPPTLTSCSVSSSTGSSSTIFNYTVTYTDADNDKPTSIQVIIDGTPHDMTKQDINDTDYTDGCIYTYTTTLSKGNHQYHFEASDGISSARCPSSGENSGPNVHGIPGFIWLFIIVVLLMAILLVIALMRKKRRKHRSQ